MSCHEGLFNSVYVVRVLLAVHDVRIPFICLQYHGSLNFWSIKLLLSCQGPCIPDLVGPLNSVVYPGPFIVGSLRVPIIFGVVWVPSNLFIPSGSLYLFLLSGSLQTCLLLQGPSFCLCCNGACDVSVHYVKEQTS